MRESSGRLEKCAIAQGGSSPSHVFKAWASVTYPGGSLYRLNKKNIQEREKGSLVADMGHKETINKREVILRLGRKSKVR